jgi:hypothetical protein
VKSPQLTPAVGNASTNNAANIKKSIDTNKPLFEKKATLFIQEVDFNKNSVITEILKIGLKAFLEYVRLVTFGQSGYHQMQLDVYFLQAVLPGFSRSPEV